MNNNQIVSSFDILTQRDKNKLLSSFKNEKIKNKRILIENKVAFYSMVFLIILFLFSFVFPLFYKYNYFTQIRGEESLPAFWQNKFWANGTGFHILGTDGLGRDILARLAKGTQISLIIGISCALLVAFIGTLYGFVSGYIGGKLDFIMTKIVDILQTIPDMLIALVLATVLKPKLAELFNINPDSIISKLFNSFGASLIAIFITFSLLYWVQISRVVRGQVKVLKNKEYVQYSRLLGKKPTYILFKHILPNCIGQVIVATSLQIPTAIFLESFLSFLGMGVNSPLTSLGALSFEAMSEIYSKPQLLVYPSVILFLIIMAINNIGDYLQNKFNQNMNIIGR